MYCWEHLMGHSLERTNRCRMENQNYFHMSPNYIVSNSFMSFLIEEKFGSRPFETKWDSKTLLNKYVYDDCTSICSFNWLDCSCVLEITSSRTLLLYEKHFTNNFDYLLSFRGQIRNARALDVNDSKFSSNTWNLLIQNLLQKNSFVGIKKKY